MVEVLDYLNRGGVLAVLIFILISGMMGKWVFAQVMVSAMAEKDRAIQNRDEQIAELRKERDEYKGLVLRTLDAADKAVVLAERRRNV